MEFNGVLSYDGPNIYYTVVYPGMEMATLQIICNIAQGTEV